MGTAKGQQIQRERVPGVKLNRKARRKYNKLFRKDPITANLWLLLLELSSKGVVVFENENREENLQRLMAARFNDPGEYAL